MSLTIDDFKDLEFHLPIQHKNSEWKGREVKETEVDPRIQFIRHLVFTYLFHLIAAPEKLEDFENRLVEKLFKDSSTPSSSPWTESRISV